MKKAKIMLMGIAVLGIVGGALAFKASKCFGCNAVICKTTKAGGPLTCTTTGGITSVVNSDPLGVITKFITAYTTDRNAFNVCTDAGYTVNLSEEYCQTSNLEAYVCAGE